MSHHNYILDKNGDAVICPDDYEWCVWHETNTHSVCHTTIQTPEITTVISTVFLGIDYNFHRVGPPILWETYISSDDPDLVDRDIMERHTSKTRAINRHFHWVENLEVPYPWIKGRWSMARKIDILSLSYPYRRIK